MSSGSKPDPWLSDGWPANEFNFADFVPRASAEELPHVAPPPPPIDASKGTKIHSGELGDAGKQPAHTSEYFFDSFKVIPELLVERLHQEYSTNLSGQQQFFAIAKESSEKAYFELKPNANHLLNNQQLGFYSEQQFQQILNNTQLIKKPAQEYSAVEVPRDAGTMSSVSLSSLNGPFVYQPFLFTTTSATYKCGCDPKGNHHFLCPNSNRPDLAPDTAKGSDSSSSTSSVAERPQNIRSDKERPFSCDECGKSFLLKHHLVTHAKVHTGLRPYGCNECGKTFTHKHCLNTHQRLHSGLRPYQCELCKKSFTLKHHLVTHQRTHEKDTPFNCESCGKNFSQKRTLNMHLKLHSGERPFSCPVCDECFAQEEQLIAHSRFHGGNSAFVCSDCGLSFARKFELVDHRRSHGHSPYACTICGKEFLQKRTLQQHSKLHDGSKPYICKYCSECFARMDELIGHAKIHTFFTCKECGCGFPTHELLIIHLQQHGRISLPGAPEPKPQPIKKHVCPDCGTAFAQKHGLSQHITRKHKSKATSTVSIPPAPVAPAAILAVPGPSLVHHVSQQPGPSSGVPVPVNVGHVPHPKSHMHGGHHRGKLH